MLLLWISLPLLYQSLPPYLSYFSLLRPLSIHLMRTFLLSETINFDSTLYNLFHWLIISFYLTIYGGVAATWLLIGIGDVGGEWPVISHAPWNGCNLADFIMPFFLFIVGISIALSFMVISLSYFHSNCFVKTLLENACLPSCFIFTYVENMKPVWSCQDCGSYFLGLWSSSFGVSYYKVTFISHLLFILHWLVCKLCCQTFVTLVIN